MQPLVSIVIPTFNRANLLGETLDSIISQNFKEWECLVIDDGSEDYTSELMEFYCANDSRFQFLHRPRNRPKGANACRNYGFKKSSGKYINFFDSDDLIHPEKLNIQFRQLENKPFDFSVSEVAFFKGKRENWDENWRGRISSDEPLTDYIKGNISWLTAAVLWKKKFLEGMDTLFDEELQASQEWEFHIRVLNLFPSYCLENRPLVLMRNHANNITNSHYFKRRGWNYYLARLKVYRNKNLNLDKETKFCLKRYLIDNFKEMVRTGDTTAFKSFGYFVLREKDFSSKVKFSAFISIFSFRLFRKGNIFLLKLTNSA